MIPFRWWICIFFFARSCGCGLWLVAVALIEGTIDEIMCQRAKRPCYRMANAVSLSNEIICGSVHLSASCSFECCDCDFDICPGVLCVRASECAVVTKFNWLWSFILWLGRVYVMRMSAHCSTPNTFSVCAKIRHSSSLAVLLGVTKKYRHPVAWIDTET